MSYSTVIRQGLLAAALASICLPAYSQTQGAPRFSPENRPLGSIAPIELSNTDLSDRPSIRLPPVAGQETDIFEIVSPKAFRPWFENGSWQGDLIQYDVSPEGVLSTTVDLRGDTPSNPAGAANWSANVNFHNASHDEQGIPNDYWINGRRIITWDATRPYVEREQPFLADRLSLATMERIDPGAGNVVALGSPILNYVRGYRGQEGTDKGQLRKRNSILGAIIHSRPVYVGRPNELIQSDGYQSWAARLFGRTPMIYVGANDGMLHAFEAKTGREVYAYVPSMLFEKLRLLTARPYRHTYFVDGELTVRDAFFRNPITGGEKRWHSLLVGTLGAGGRGFFGLDVTASGLFDQQGNAVKKVLFEFDDTNDRDLGDSFSRAAIARLNDGNWYVVIGNGFNSWNGVAMLYLVNLDTLSVRKLSTRKETVTREEPDPNPNGLASPALLDVDRDGMVDYVYAGDIAGNLWKFDLSDEDPVKWGVAFDHNPLHPAPANHYRPITTAPQLARHPIHGYMVYFGTGRLYTREDMLDDTSVQALYGIWDKSQNWTPPDSGSQNLLAQIWLEDLRYTGQDPDGRPVTQDIGIYEKGVDGEIKRVNWANQHGWVIEFPPGYRVLQPVQVRANRVKATVHKPRGGEDGRLGANWLLEASLQHGGPNPKPIFDLNTDMVLDDSDRYRDEGQEADWHVPMIWRQPDGIMSQVTIAVVRSGVDTQFLNYLQPAFHEPCSDECVNGFLGGHIDVDTWSDGASPTGESSTHTHRYDKRAGRVFVDFFDLNATADPGEGVSGHVNIQDSSNIPENEQFIVLIANADLSPGSTLHIGGQEWSAVDYQRAVYDAMQAWDPDVEGSEPSSLIFTWGDLQGAGGIRHSFDDRAIMDGGVHATQPRCVRNAVHEVDPADIDGFTDGRWRNGALATQLVRKDSLVTRDDIEALMVSIDDDGDGVISPEEKGMGGLVTTSSGAHLWEGTLFWHYGELAGLVLGLALEENGTLPPMPCYGEEGWAELVALELRLIPIIGALLRDGRANNEALERLYDEIDSITGCRSLGPDSCFNFYRILEGSFSGLAEYILPPLSDVTGLDGDGETAGGVIGGVSESGPTEGQIFESGRVSWSDLVR